MTTDVKDPAEQAEEIKHVPSLKELCELVPPGGERWVDRALVWKQPMHTVTGTAKKPHLICVPIVLHCNSPQCQGERNFEAADVQLLETKSQEVSARYVCRNCRSNNKRYIFNIEFEGTGPEAPAKLNKLIEFPPFGVPTPSRVSSLVGSEREYFFKGRQAENMGLGIAAFAYYRRVIENQRNKIFDEILRVSKALSASPELIAELEAAKLESQFSKAIELIKHGIPQSLFINGHNPLTLLHSALSEGLHAHTDAECLEIATDVRLVLFAFVERVASALKDDAALNSAVARLANRRQSGSGIKPG